MPLRNGAERLGVLHVLADRPDDVDEQLVRALAAMVALFVASKRAFSDAYPRLVRSRPMNVAAEMLWHLMPPLTFANAEVTVAGVLEPPTRSAATPSTTRWRTTSSIWRSSTPWGTTWPPGWPPTSLWPPPAACAGRARTWPRTARASRACC